MAINSRLFFAFAAGALALSANTVSAADLPPVTAVSMKVQPQAAILSPGSMLSLGVRCEGISGVGTNAPLSITGAPEGTSIEVLPQSEQYALVSLVFPATVSKGRYSLSVKVGGPEPLMEQKVEIEIGEKLP